MDVRAVETGDGRYLEVLPGTLAFECEEQALDLVVACAEHRTLAVLLHTDALTDRFLDLSTGLAGGILQKFVNYHLRVAILVPGEIPEGRFREYVREANRGSHVRTFALRPAAEAWLAGS